MKAGVMVACLGMATVPYRRLSTTSGRYVRVRRKTGEYDGLRVIWHSNFVTALGVTISSLLSLPLCNVILQCLQLPLQLCKMRFPLQAQCGLEHDKITYTLRI
ncbi:hypothetical protein BT69DRAFT_38320 [Atractiella rhizophila]|nr:hypothetical protein BT69DRAFT_38320 [Atractiella rhizophila]